MDKNIFLPLAFFILLLLLFGCVNNGGYTQELGGLEDLKGIGNEIRDGINKVNNNSSFFQKTIIREERNNGESIQSIEVDISNLYKKKNLTENISDEIRYLERETFDLINKEREKKRLEKLKWNEELAYVARQHSKYLASKNKGFSVDLYISHKNNEGEYHYDRLEKNGIYYFISSAENIFGISKVKTYYKKNMSPVEYYDIKDLPFIAATSWMNSELHRENILKGEFDESGIGVAKDETGTNYIFTQLFIKRTDCGYRYGKCCEKPGYYPYCLVPLKCEYNYCLGREDVEKLDIIIKQN